MAQQLEAELDWLEDNADQAGPFFLGAEFSLVVRRSLTLLWQAQIDNTLKA